MREIMQETLKGYKEHLELLKMELSEKKEEVKRVEKAKKLVEKMGTDLIEVKDVEIDRKAIEEVEKNIKLCKSIIRRYETLLNNEEVTEEQNDEQ